MGMANRAGQRIGCQALSSAKRSPVSKAYCQYCAETIVKKIIEGMKNNR